MNIAYDIISFSISINFIELDLISIFKSLKKNKSIFMLRTNKNRLSFASLSIKPQSALLDDPYHTSTLHFEKILTASELEPMSIYQSSTREK